MYENQMSYDQINLADASGQSTEALKVPPNAFSLFFKEQHDQLTIDNPILSENDICRQIGRVWLLSSDEFKQKYRAEARKLRLKFKADNPTYSDKLLKKKKPRPESANEPHPITVKVIINHDQVSTEILGTSVPADN
ncbi:HMG box family protein [Trichomonas vaginalis G3]|uniref:HMG box family protein n=1 Tax=Trichomonas vaginalis (strain ATCC PRA-98 / G3) TaxID=412133 RepID=A2DF38_TRIV3|nr:HMG-box family [Trichomonas vaginalis G3]EAY21030.1 HMG box family protein [Trichomonas vaginalis G3]KAI5519205.1 HMG-box family [Trichomonas vaginalis G3]|eukprot:XP_001582016.1 HMG box family protein [Trichomonas vaginalis G3]